MEALDNVPSERDEATPKMVAKPPLRTQAAQYVLIAAWINRLIGDNTPPDLIHCWMPLASVLMLSHAPLI